MAWKKDYADGYAVLLEGARRVGKSTIAEHFARSEYRSYILIDFSKVTKDFESYKLYLSDTGLFVTLIIMKWISWSGRKFAIKTILSDVIFDVALFLVVVNWFDGIVIDRWWVGHGRIWKIKGMEDMSFVKSWKTVLVNRSLATLMYLVLSFVVAGIVVGIGKII